MAEVEGVRELPPGKSKGFQAKRRQKTTMAILRQAGKLLAEKGYHGFTVEDLADRVEMSKGNLYHYFPSKEVLLYACEKAATELVFDCVSAEVEKCENPDAVARLRVWVMAHLGFLIEEFPLAWFFLQEDRRLAGQYRREIIALRHRYEHFVDALLRDGVDQGKFTPCDIATTRNLILGGLNWTATWYVSGRSPTVAQLGEQYGRQITAMLMARQEHHTP
jgi:AcrR family transcriptional regulator